MNIEWQVSRDPRWTTAVYDDLTRGTLQLLVRDGATVTVTVSGPCPRCSHQFTDTDILRGAVDLGVAAETDADDSDGSGDEKRAFREQLPPATLRCTCNEQHRGRRGVKTGCGIYFTVIAGR